MLYLFHMSRVFGIDGCPDIGTIEGFRPMVRPDVCSLSSPPLQDSVIFLYNSTASYLFLVSRGRRLWNSFSLLKNTMIASEDHARSSHVTRNGVQILLVKLTALLLLSKVIFGHTVQYKFLMHG